MRIKKGVRIRGMALVLSGALLLGLILACSLFNQAPVARIVANVLSGNSPLAVTFNATTSTDADGTITAYAWNFGDEDTDTGANVTHTFTATSAIETFEVTLTITDNNGASSQATQTIEVYLNGEGPSGTDMPTARFTASKFIGVSPLIVTFDGTASTPGTGTIAAYNWNFADGTQKTGAQVTHTFIPDPETTTTYPATLYVWNSNDQVDTEQLEIIVIVPDNDTGDEEPVADIFVDGPDIIYESDDRPNIASLFEVEFDPSGSYADAGHSIDYYAWDFGDGDLQVETSDLKVTHIYALTAPSQTLVAKLTVFDDQGLEHTDVVNITLTQD
ncbi:PKD domain-containing protein [Candidatus Bipolaricaulota bacterium]